MPSGQRCNGRLQSFFAAACRCGRPHMSRTPFHVAFSSHSQASSVIGLLQIDCQESCVGGRGFQLRSAFTQVLLIAAIHSSLCALQYDHVQFRVPNLLCNMLVFYLHCGLPISHPSVCCTVGTCLSVSIAFGFNCFLPGCGLVLTT